MEKINFEDGQLTKKGYVVIDGKEYLINEAQYDGATPLSAYVLNKMQDNIEEGINNIQALPVGGTKGQVLTKQSETEGDANWEDIEANEVFVGKEEEAPDTAKIIIEDEDFEEGSTLSKAEVYVGAEEPTTGEKVWFRKGKNLFDENNIYNILYNNETIAENSAWGMSDFIKVSSNTKYTMSSTLSSGQTTGQIQINEFDESKNYITSTFSNVTLLEFTTNVTTKYLRIGYRVDRQENIMLEQGNYTSYERYIEPQIFVRNSNGVYEEFIKKSEEVYSTEEQRIGTWIDGKPLYRIIKEYDVSAKETQSNDISSIPYDTIFINFGKSFNRWVANSSSSIIWNTSDNDKGNVWINYEKKLNILNSSNAARHYWITLEYTKTTD